MGAIDRGIELPLTKLGVEACSARDRSGPGLSLQRVERFRRQYRVEPGKTAAVAAVSLCADRQRTLGAIFADPLRPGRAEPEVARIRDQCAERRRIWIGPNGCDSSSRLNNAAFAFKQRAGIAGGAGNGEAVELLDFEQRRFAAPGIEPAAGRQAISTFYRPAFEVVLQDQIDHPGIGRTAKAQRDLFRQDLDPLDRFRRIVAHLAEIGDPLAVDQDQRHPAFAPAPAGAGLRADARDQFAHRSCAQRLNFGLVKGRDRSLRSFDLPAKFGRDDQNVGVAG